MTVISPEKTGLSIDCKPVEIVKSIVNEGTVITKNVKTAKAASIIPTFS
jgi:hypothetical protein